MTGTLAVALAARKIPTQPDRLSSEVEGIIENVDGKPLVTTIKVHYKVKVPRGKREEALRAIEVHEKGCPASQSVKRGITIEWDGHVEEEASVA
ncbi:MAG: OsmC family protein [candidate division NC10 bacterium]|nr:OsmC family protein [candidate division NC10 bacterium]MBI2115945.1 OsmC family protein [candidate division NC10 bacterium]MBI2562174.1 OsmC family protein [candidate division NC10 bacterium]MBI3087191.1 OsmC family protein [candidate division NC10 bacterium]